ncbi:probable arginine--tRNA ligase, mitochondrial isoform X2 [Daktulosphaira vitifoliae]|nr:probable arginine--tRNA ligase, mitochondrial isoform X2 [Daktulosphaira vitifoliae]
MNAIIANMKIGYRTSEQCISFRLPSNILYNDMNKCKTSIINDINANETLNTIQLNTKMIEINLNNNDFINKVFKSDMVEQIPHTYSLNRLPQIIEFSSPNIAKPFHVGHFRSTIIGNFLSNLFKFLNGNIIKLNYLGDYGPQFGYILLGLENLQKENPNCKLTIETLHKAYVLANKLSEEDNDIHRKAKAIFNDLEFGNSTSEVAELWNNFRSTTVKELGITYKRLGVVFDQYDWESNYSKIKISNIIEKLEKMNILKYKNDGSGVIYCNNQETTVLKNDKCTLYLLRDIAAAVDRFKRFKSKNLYYVVDNTQSKHFYQLKSIINKINPQISINHVPFGRIHGMSSRKGKGVLMNQLLDEAKSIMILRRENSQTTKKQDQDENKISDILGISAIIINDLKQRRKKDYNFSWESALQVNGDTGIKLQYTHCRLESLIEVNSNLALPFQVNAEYLKDPIAIELIIEICRYENILNETKNSLEACILVNYLFRLCNCINKALKILNVKNSSVVYAEQRLLLFYRAKSVLSSGMEILGLMPLKSM